LSETGLSTKKVRMTL